MMPMPRPRNSRPGQAGLYYELGDGSQSQSRGSGLAMAL